MAARGFSLNIIIIGFDVNQSVYNIIIAVSFCSCKLDGIGSKVFFSLKQSKSVKIWFSSKEKAYLKFYPSGIFYNV